MKKCPIEKKFFKRRPDTHKGDYGHALLVAGSIGLTGAAYLASQGALLSGSGLVTLAIPKSLNTILASKLVEVMTLPTEDEGRGYFSVAGFPEIMRYTERVNVLAIGPGISQQPSVKEFVKRLIQAADKPMVIDADGINNISDDPHILKKAKKEIVLTPHPGEMARFIHKDIGYVQKRRKDVAIEAAKKYNVVLVLKGINTVVASPKGDVYINETGNPGMASAGVGDILTGIISGFCALGLSPFNAARFAVYIHGLAGDIAAKEKGEISLIARDVLDNIHKALKSCI